MSLRLLVCSAKNTATACRVGKGAGHRLSTRESVACAVPTKDGAPCIDADGGHGVREALIGVEGRASAHSPSKTGVNALMAHPTTLCITLTQKKIGPCLRLWARGRPYFLTSVSLEIEGVGAPTRRIARIAPGGVRITPDVGREASRPAPCCAPTRHLCL